MTALRVTWCTFHILCLVMSHMHVASTLTTHGRSSIPLQPPTSITTFHAYSMHIMLRPSQTEDDRVLILKFARTIDASSLLISSLITSCCQGCSSLEGACLKWAWPVAKWVWFSCVVGLAGGDGDGEGVGECDGGGQEWMAVSLVF